MLRLLNNANVVTLNMKLIDLPEFLNARSWRNPADSSVRHLFGFNLKRKFCGLELYNGHSIAEMQGDNKKLEDYLRILRKTFKKDEFGFEWIN